MQRRDLQPDQKLARTSGLLYLLMMTSIALPYTITQNLTTGDPAAEIAKLKASRVSYQFAIIGGATGFVVFLLLGLSLYRLLRTVHEAAATVMLAFVSIHVPISLAAIARQMDALALVRDPIVADSGMVRQLALSLLGYNSLWLISMIFSGLWLIPLGWLVYQCGFMPKAIGIFLMLGSVF